MDDFIEAATSLILEDGYKQLGAIQVRDVFVSKVTYFKADGSIVFKKMAFNLTSTISRFLFWF